VTVPAVVLLGFISGQMSNSGYENRWFAALSKPDIIPPGWVFGAVWSVLYILLGIALAMILFARGAKGRFVALALFFAQLGLNLLWSPLFFAAHQVSLAFWRCRLPQPLHLRLFARLRPGCSCLIWCG
jgi:translocator protein